MKETLNVDSIFEKNLDIAKTSQVAVSKPVFEEPLSGKGKVNPNPVSKVTGPKHPADTINSRFTSTVTVLNRNLLALSYSSARNGTDEMQSISRELEDCRDMILGLQEDINSLLALN